MIILKTETGIITNLVVAMEKRQNYSRKREAIYEAICGTDIHPTADWIYQTLKPVYPDLSLGTVYRNISRFKEEGKIVSVGVVNGQERLDGNTVPHSHFICKVCGRVLDVGSDGVITDGHLDQSIAKRYGCQVDFHDLVFHGTCSHCL